MKKILLSVMTVCTMLFGTTSCNEDYTDFSTKHVYGEFENPPLKGSDANMVTTADVLEISKAGTETVVVKLSDFAAQIKKQLGMSYEEAAAGLKSGEVRFLMVNPIRRIWDKNPGNAGENKWVVNAQGIVAGDAAVKAATVEFVPSTMELKISLNKDAASGIIPVTVGLVKTDDSSYPTNFRCQVQITAADETMVKVDVSVPQGDYASTLLPFSSLTKNIQAALGVSDLKKLAEDLDIDAPQYDVFLMNASGLYGGPGKYTANGAGYWLTADNEIVNWGVAGFTYFIEPDIYDWDAEDYYANGGGFTIGRLSNDTPASGTVIKTNIVIKPKEGKKNLTIMATITFE